MHFSQLINRSLKDNSIIEILEHYGIDVVYDFDRTNENEDDLYWAAAQKIGFQFRFLRMSESSRFLESNIF